jgi:RNase H-like domain found in reverse transcriptase/Reverse transcriptase (RNA-dependent DNA polymerase)/Integrase zinc binding domain/Retroviral aspartyl protease
VIGRLPRAGTVSCAEGPPSAALIEGLITLTGSIDGVRVLRSFLVDGGATSNFVSASLVQRADLTTSRLDQSLFVRMANGALVQCERMLPSALVTVSGYSGTHTFIVMDDLDGFDAILGRPFLCEAGALVDHAAAAVVWSGKSLSRPEQRRRVRLASARSEHVRDAEFVCELLAGSNTLVQDGVLRACGLAAQPAEDRVVLPEVPGAELDGLMHRVSMYEAAMKPLQGCLPPSRGDYDHQIVLNDPAAEPCKRRAIPLNHRQQQSLKRQLDELLAAGLIRPSRSPWAAPVFFVPKEGGDDRMVCDYRGLNALIKKNNSSLPHVKELLARLNKGRVFTKLDLRSGYHQVRLRPSDIEFTGFVTPHGHFEWLVMPFGEANAPATFTRLMSQLVLHDLLHSFVIVFQDDILVFSENEKEHVGHVQQVLDRLRRHSLFLKPSKCQFMRREVEFLGYVIRATNTGTVIATCESKVQAIREWPVPVTVTELRAFLGMCNFYRDFVDGHSHIAAPLTALTAIGKRTARLVWTEAEASAFEALKAALCCTPVLAIADDDRPFVLHVDACAYAIGAVLSQLDDRGKLRPIGYFSRKLTDTQLRWDVYEKELYSIVAALEHWSMHLRGSSHEFVVYTDHRSLETLLEQPRLTGKQTRWLLLLSLYRFELRYIAGEENVVADALSRRSDHDDGSEHRRLVQTTLARQEFELTGNSSRPARVEVGGAPELGEDSRAAAGGVPVAAVHGSEAGSDARRPLSRIVSELPAPKEVAVSAAAIGSSVGAFAVSVVDGSSLLDEVRAAYQHDAECKEILAAPERHNYFLRDGLLLRHSDFGVLVPADRALRTRLLHEAHDAPMSGHFGLEKSIARIASSWYWPSLRRDLAAYIATCTSCQQGKPVNAKRPGLMKPIAVEEKGSVISIDFIGPLPRTSRGHDYIVTIVDKFSKKCWYEPAKQTITAKQVAEIVFRRVVPEQLLPSAIITDRDARFTSKLWNELWLACGSKVRLSTAYHQQSDGQTERQNRTVEETLRAYVNERGSDWDRHLLYAELAHNTAVQASTGFTPMRLHSGILGRSPLDLAAAQAKGSMPATGSAAAEFLDRWNQDARKAKANLERAQARQKKYYDRRRRPVQFKVGDRALICGDELNFRGEGSRKLRPRYEGPFAVLDVDEDGLDVTLDLPSPIGIHPTMHVDRLRRMKEAAEGDFPGRVQVERRLPQLAPDPNDLHIPNEPKDAGLVSSGDEGVDASTDQSEAALESDGDEWTVVGRPTRSRVRAAWDRGDTYNFATL